MISTRASAGTDPRKAVPVAWEIFALMIAFAPAMCEMHWPGAKLLLHQCYGRWAPVDYGA